MLDDPKDRVEEPDDLELEDGAEADEGEEPEVETANDEPADEPGDDEEERPEPKDDFVRVPRSEYDRLQRGGDRRPATDPKPDPLAVDYEEMLKDEKVPLSVKRVVHGLAGRTVAAENRAAAAEQIARRSQVQSIPEKHRARVTELVDKFGLTPEIALQLHKGELYDQAMQRKRTKREGGGEREVETPPRRPAEQRGSAKHTTTTRAVRREPEAGVNGDSVRVKGYPNLKIPLEFPNSTAYEKYMDSLSPEHREVVFKVRRAGTAAKIRGQG